jgi:hypothetical protein
MGDELEEQEGNKNIAYAPASLNISLHQNLQKQILVRGFTLLGFSPK